MDYAAESYYDSKKINPTKGDGTLSSTMANMKSKIHADPNDDNNFSQHPWEGEQPSMSPMLASAFRVGESSRRGLISNEAQDDGEEDEEEHQQEREPEEVNRQCDYDEYYPDNSRQKYNYHSSSSLGDSGKFSKLRNSSRKHNFASSPLYLEDEDDDYEEDDGGEKEEKWFKHLVADATSDLKRERGEQQADMAKKPSLYCPHRPAPPADRAAAQCPHSHHPPSPLTQTALSCLLGLDGEDRTNDNLLLGDKNATACHEYELEEFNRVRQRDFAGEQQSNSARRGRSLSRNRVNSISEVGGSERHERKPLTPIPHPPVLTRHTAAQYSENPQYYKDLSRHHHRERIQKEKEVAAREKIKRKSAEKDEDQQEDPEWFTELIHEVRHDLAKEMEQWGKDNGIWNNNNNNNNNNEIMSSNIRKDIKEEVNVKDTDASKIKSKTTSKDGNKTEAAVDIPSSSSSSSLSSADIPEILHFLGSKFVNTAAKLRELSLTDGTHTDELFCSPEYEHEQQQGKTQQRAVHVDDETVIVDNTFDMPLPSAGGAKKLPITNQKISASHDYAEKQLAHIRRHILNAVRSRRSVVSEIDRMRTELSHERYLHNKQLLIEQKHLENKHKQIQAEIASAASGGKRKNNNKKKKIETENEEEEENYAALQPPKSDKNKVEKLSTPTRIGGIYEDDDEELIIMNPLGLTTNELLAREESRLARLINRLDQRTSNARRFDSSALHNHKVTSISAGSFGLVRGVVGDLSSKVSPAFSNAKIHGGNSLEDGEVQWFVYTYDKGLNSLVDQNQQPRGTSETFNKNKSEPKQRQLIQAKVAVGEAVRAASQLILANPTPYSEENPDFFAYEYSEPNISLHEDRKEGDDGEDNGEKGFGDVVPRDEDEKKSKSSSSSSLSKQQPTTMIRVWLFNKSQQEALKQRLIQDLREAKQERENERRLAGSGAPNVKAGDDDDDLDDDDDFDIDTYTNRFISSMMSGQQEYVQLKTTTTTAKDRDRYVDDINNVAETKAETTITGTLNIDHQAGTTNTPSRLDNGNNNSSAGDGGGLPPFASASPLQIPKLHEDEGKVEDALAQKERLVEREEQEERRQGSGGRVVGGGGGGGEEKEKDPSQLFSVKSNSSAESDEEFRNRMHDVLVFVPPTPTPPLYPRGEKEEEVTTEPRTRRINANKEKEMTLDELKSIRERAVANDQMSNHELIVAAGSAPRGIARDGDEGEKAGEEEVDFRLHGKSLSPFKNTDAEEVTHASPISYDEVGHVSLGLERIDKENSTISSSAASSPSSSPAQRGGGQDSQNNNINNNQPQYARRHDQHRNGLPLARYSPVVTGIQPADAPCFEEDRAFNNNKNNTDENENKVIAPKKQQNENEKNDDDADEIACSTLHKAKRELTSGVKKTLATAPHSTSSTSTRKKKIKASSSSSSSSLSTASLLRRLKATNREFEAASPSDTNDKKSNAIQKESLLALSRHKMDEERMTRRSMTEGKEEEEEEEGDEGGKEKRQQQLLNNGEQQCVAGFSQNNSRINNNSDLNITIISPLSGDAPRSPDDNDDPRNTCVSDGQRKEELSGDDIGDIKRYIFSTKIGEIRPKKSLPDDDGLPRNVVLIRKRKTQQQQPQQQQQQGDKNLRLHNKMNAAASNLKKPLKQQQQRGERRKRDDDTSEVEDSPPPPLPLLFSGSVQLNSYQPTRGPAKPLSPPLNDPADLIESFYEASEASSLSPSFDISSSEISKNDVHCKNPNRQTASSSSPSIPAVDSDEKKTKRNKKMIKMSKKDLLRSVSKNNSTNAEFDRMVNALTVVLSPPSTTTDDENMNIDDEDIADYFVDGKILHDRTGKVGSHKISTISSNSPKNEKKKKSWVVSDGVDAQQSENDDGSLDSDAEAEKQYQENLQALRHQQQDMLIDKGLLTPPPQTKATTITDAPPRSSESTAPPLLPIADNSRPRPFSATGAFVDNFNAYQQNNRRSQTLQIQQKDENDDNNNNEEVERAAYLWQRQIGAASTMARRGNLQNEEEPATTHMYGQDEKEEGGEVLYLENDNNNEKEESNEGSPLFSDTDAEEERIYQKKLAALRAEQQARLQEREDRRVRETDEDLMNTTASASILSDSDAEEERIYQEKLQALRAEQQERLRAQELPSSGETIHTAKDSTSRGAQPRPATRITGAAVAAVFDGLVDELDANDYTENDGESEEYTSVTPLYNKATSDENEEEACAVDDLVRTPLFSDSDAEEERIYQEKLQALRAEQQERLRARELRRLEILNEKEESNEGSPLFSDTDAEEERIYQKKLAALRAEQQARLQEREERRVREAGQADEGPIGTNISASILSDSDAEEERIYQEKLQALRAEQQSRLVNQGLLSPPAEGSDLSAIEPNDANSSSSASATSPPPATSNPDSPPITNPLVPPSKLKSEEGAARRVGFAVSDENRVRTSTMNNGSSGSTREEGAYRSFRPIPNEQYQRSSMSSATLRPQLSSAVATTITESVEDVGAKGRDSGVVDEEEGIILYRRFNRQVKEDVKKSTLGYKDERNPSSSSFAQKSLYPLGGEGWASLSSPTGKESHRPRRASEIVVKEDEIAAYKSSTDGTKDHHHRNHDGDDETFSTQQRSSNNIYNNYNIFTASSLTPSERRMITDIQYGRFTSNQDFEMVPKDSHDKKKKQRLMVLEERSIQAEGSGGKRKFGKDTVGATDDDEEEALAYFAANRKHAEIISMKHVKPVAGTLTKRALQSEDGRLSAGKTILIPRAVIMPPFYAGEEIDSYLLGPHLGDNSNNTTNTNNDNEWQWSRLLSRISAHHHHAVNKAQNKTIATAAENPDEYFHDPDEEDQHVCGLLAEEDWMTVDDEDYDDQLPVSDSTKHTSRAPEALQKRRRPLTNSDAAKIRAEYLRAAMGQIENNKNKNNHNDKNRNDSDVVPLTGENGPSPNETNAKGGVGVAPPLRKSTPMVVAEHAAASKDQHCRPTRGGIDQKKRDFIADTFSEHAYDPRLVKEIANSHAITAASGADLTSPFDLNDFDNHFGQCCAKMMVVSRRAFAHASASDQKRSDALHHHQYGAASSSTCFDYDEDDYFNFMVDDNNNNNNNNNDDENSSIKEGNKEPQNDSYHDSFDARQNVSYSAAATPHGGSGVGEASPPFTGAEPSHAVVYVGVVGGSPSSAAPNRIGPAARSATKNLTAASAPTVKTSQSSPASSADVRVKRDGLRGEEGEVEGEGGLLLDEIAAWNEWYSPDDPPETNGDQKKRTTNIIKGGKGKGKRRSGGIPLALSQPYACQQQQHSGGTTVLIDALLEDEGEGEWHGMYGVGTGRSGPLYPSPASPLGPVVMFSEAAFNSDHQRGDGLFVNHSVNPHYVHAANTVPRSDEAFSRAGECLPSVSPTQDSNGAHHTAAVRHREDNVHNKDQPSVSDDSITYSAFAIDKNGTSAYRYLSTFEEKMTIMRSTKAKAATTTTGDEEQGRGIAFADSKTSSRTRRTASDATVESATCNSVSSLYILTPSQRAELLRLQEENERRENAAIQLLLLQSDSGDIQREEEDEGFDDDLRTLSMLAPTIAKKCGGTNHASLLASPKKEHTMMMDATERAPRRVSDSGDGIDRSLLGLAYDYPATLFDFAHIKGGGGEGASPEMRGSDDRNAKTRDTANDNTAFAERTYKEDHHHLQKRMTVSSTPVMALESIDAVVTTLQPSSSSSLSPPSDPSYPHNETRIEEEEEDGGIEGVEQVQVEFVLTGLPAPIAAVFSFPYSDSAYCVDDECRAGETKIPRAFALDEVFAAKPKGDPNSIVVMALEPLVVTPPSSSAVAVRRLPIVPSTYPYTNEIRERQEDGGRFVQSRSLTGDSTFPSSPYYSASLAANPSLRRRRRSDSSAPDLSKSPTDPSAVPIPPARLTYIPPSRRLLLRSDAQSSPLLPSGRPIIDLFASRSVDNSDKDDDEYEGDLEHEPEEVETKKRNAISNKNNTSIDEAGGQHNSASTVAAAAVAKNEFTACSSMTDLIAMVIDNTKDSKGHENDNKHSVTRATIDWFAVGTKKFPHSFRRLLENVDNTISNTIKGDEEEETIKNVKKAGGKQTGERAEEVLGLNVLDQVDFLVIDPFAAARRRRALVVSAADMAKQQAATTRGVEISHERSLKILNKMAERTLRVKQNKNENRAKLARKALALLKLEAREKERVLKYGGSHGAARARDAQLFVSSKGLSDRPPPLLRSTPAAVDMLRMLTSEPGAAISNEPLHMPMPNSSLRDEQPLKQEKTDNDNDTFSPVVSPSVPFTVKRTNHTNRGKRGYVPLSGDDDDGGVAAQPKPTIATEELKSIGVSYELFSGNKVRCGRRALPPDWTFVGTRLFPSAFAALIRADYETAGYIRVPRGLHEQHLQNVVEAEAKMNDEDPISKTAWKRIEPDNVPSSSNQHSKYFDIVLMDPFAAHKLRRQQYVSRIDSDKRARAASNRQRILEKTRRTAHRMGNLKNSTTHRTSSLIVIGEVTTTSSSTARANSATRGLCVSTIRTTTTMSTTAPRPKNEKEVAAPSIKLSSAAVA